MFIVSEIVHRKLQFGPSAKYTAEDSNKAKYTKKTRLTFDRNNASVSMDMSYKDLLGTPDLDK